MPGINTAGTKGQKRPLGQGIGEASAKKPTTTIAMTNSHCLFEMNVGAPL
jgi:hypothetical protein